MRWCAPPVTARLAVISLAVALRTVTGPAEARAQCRPADTVSARMVASLTQDATGTDQNKAQIRATMHLPQVSASQVTYVTSKTVCSKILPKYNANSGQTPPITPSGQLYVVQVGTVYVAWDPVKMMGEYEIYVILDKSYSVLASSLY